MMKVIQKLGAGLLVLGLLAGCGDSSEDIVYSTNNNSPVVAVPVPSPSPQGEFVQEVTGQIVSYRASNGWLITIVADTITMTDPSGRNSVEFFGGGTENLNGKEVKNFEDRVRTVLLPGDVKVTVETSGTNRATADFTTTSVYDGNFNFEVDNARIVVDYQGTDTAQRDAAQPDGETAEVVDGRAPGSIAYNNVYFEDDTFSVTETRFPIAYTGGTANPGQVTDVISKQL